MEPKSIPAHMQRAKLTAKFDFRKELALPERLKFTGPKICVKVLIKISCKQLMRSTLIMLLEKSMFIKHPFLSWIVFNEGIISGGTSFSFITVNVKIPVSLPVFHICHHRNQISFVVFSYMLEKESQTLFLKILCI